MEDGSGDLGRIIRVHEFLRVLATAVSKRGLGNVLTDNSLLGAVAPDLEIDSKLSLSDMVDLLTAFHSTDIAAVPELTMPNIENFADYYYEGYDFGSVVLPTYPQDQQAIDKFLGLKRPPASAVAPGKVTVSVTNGSGVAGQATTTANQLSSLGFHVVGIGSADVRRTHLRDGRLLQARGPARCRACDRGHPRHRRHGTGIDRRAEPT